MKMYFYSLINEANKPKIEAVYKKKNVMGR